MKDESSNQAIEVIGDEAFRMNGTFSTGTASVQFSPAELAALSAEELNVEVVRKLSGADRYDIYFQKISDAVDAVVSPSVAEFFNRVSAAIKSRRAYIVTPKSIKPSYYMFNGVAMTTQTVARKALAATRPSKKLSKTHYYRLAGNKPMNLPITPAEKASRQLKKTAAISVPLQRKIKNLETNLASTTTKLATRTKQLSKKLATGSTALKLENKKLKLANAELGVKLRAKKPSPESGLDLEPTRPVVDDQIQTETPFLIPHFVSAYEAIEFAQHFITQFATEKPNEIVKLAVALTHMCADSLPTPPKSPKPSKKSAKRAKKAGVRSYAAGAEKVPAGTTARDFLEPAAAPVAEEHASADGLSTFYTTEAGATYKIHKTHSSDRGFRVNELDGHNFGSTQLYTTVDAAKNMIANLEASYPKPVKTKPSQVSAS
jgi:hypothetical protein